jgi:hypothetical protein
VAFPQITGCSTFKETIDTLLELPRNDIQMALDFKVTKGQDPTCGPDETGTYPDCVPNAKDPNLARVVLKGPKKVKAGKKFRLKAQIKNNGEGDATNVKVCAQTPKKLIVGKAKRCLTIKTIAAGKTGTVTFKLKAKKAAKKAKKAARKKAKISVTAPTGAAKAGGPTGRRQYQPIILTKK